jgi:hypothetical protein
MSRLAVARAYFIERFFAALEGDPELVGLTQPAELFDGAGALAVSADEAGFARIPSPAAVQRRAAVASGVPREHLERFGRVLARALGQIATAGPIGADRLAAMAERFCPYIHHQPGERFLPVDMADYLRVKELGLESKLYTAAGQRSLAGDIAGALFENPEVWNAPPPSGDPYVAKVPFLAAVGVGAALPGFPQTSLKFGQLDLSAADVRLSPSRMLPTIYAEAKTVYGALRVNRAYGAAASGRGRFAPLRNNRIHADPLLGEHRLVATVGNTTIAATTGAGAGTADGLMLVYHLFYGLDDGARRHPGLLATNREFHHLAMGLLFERIATAAEDARPSLVFTCRGPDLVKVMPFPHSSLVTLDHAGELDASGDHVVGYSETAGERRRRRIELKQEAMDASQEASEHRQSSEDEQAAANAAAASAAALGAAAAAAGVPPAAALLFLLAALLALLGKLRGDSHDDEAALLEKKAGEADLDAQGQLEEEEKRRREEREQQPGSDLAWYGKPPGPRKAVIKIIPHGTDRNLYGLRADGPDTLAIDDDPALREMLAWWSFPGGVGYQFDCPGARDAAGSSLRSYFDLFLRKLIELREAQALVSYFGP